MRNSYYLLLILLPSVILTGCGPARRIAEMHASADQAWELQNYQDALFYYEGIIDLQTGRGRDVSGRTYYRAGMAAHETGHTRKTTEYLRLSHRSDFATEKSNYILASAYREIDNLSLEISSLEEYSDNYPDGENIDEVQERLFDVYMESNNFEKALDMWPLIESRVSGDPEFMEKYLVLNRELENEDVLEDIANQILALDKDNRTAIEYLAEKYFWQAENRYQQEMKAYEQEKTRAQYRQLLNALDEINLKFRTARDYFERLYANDPNRQYATYLMNIYIRFGDEERAEYYRKRAN
jgi:tetratricopeptide (TPR) repeat protein